MTGERPAEAPRDSETAATPRVTARWKAVAVLISVFVLGGAAGAAAGRITAMREMRHLVEGPPLEARARFRVEAMRRHLDLRDDQVARVRAIMDEADGERDKLMAGCGPGLEELRARTDTRIREVLDEPQRRRFDDLAARRGHPRGPGHWPPPPPP